MEEHDVVADHGGPADHDAHAVVDEDPAAEVRTGVDLHPGERPGGLGQQAGGQVQGRLAPHAVGHPVRPHGVDARVAQRDLGERARGGVAPARDLQVLAQHTEEAPQVRHQSSRSA